jgi:hypothetical protein
MTVVDCREKKKGSSGLDICLCNLLAFGFCCQFAQDGQPMLRCILER